MNEIYVNIVKLVIKIILFDLFIEIFLIIVEKLNEYNSIIFIGEILGVEKV